MNVLEARGSISFTFDNFEEIYISFQGQRLHRFIVFNNGRSSKKIGRWAFIY